MKLNNISSMLEKACEKNYNRLLFDFMLGEIKFKCLLLVKNRVLMISNVSCSIGHSIPINKNGEMETYLPGEFYKSIIEELKRRYNDNKINLMWKEFDEYLSKIDIEKISESNEHDINGIIATLKTKDKKYDSDGKNPYFKTWVRNDIKSLTNNNNNKTARYFGDEIAKLCKENNISSRWSDVIQKKSLDFLNIDNVEKEIKRLV